MGFIRSFITNLFKRMGFGQEERIIEEKVVQSKRSLPATPINPMLDEVENSNTVTHDLIHELEKNKVPEPTSPAKQAKPITPAKPTKPKEDIPQKTEAINKDNQDTPSSLSTSLNETISPPDTTKNKTQANSDKKASTTIPEVKEAIATAPKTKKASLDTIEEISSKPAETMEPDVKHNKKSPASPKKASSPKKETKTKTASKEIKGEYPFTSGKVSAVMFSDEHKSNKDKHTVKVNLNDEHYCYNTQSLTWINDDSIEPLESKLKIKLATFILKNIPNTPSSAPKTIILEKNESKLTVKNKRVVGVCKNNPELFKVTHIVKEDSDKLRLNLSYSDWSDIEGLNFVTYDKKKKALIFSNKCHTDVANLIKPALLIWAKEIHQTYYAN